LKMALDKIEGETTRPILSMFIAGVAAVGDASECSATLDVAIDQNRSTIAVTVDDEFGEKKVSFRLSIGEAKVLASILSSVSSLVRADDVELEGEGEGEGE
jgi:hypothetical protein